MVRGAYLAFSHGSEDASGAEIREAVSYEVLAVTDQLLLRLFGFLDWLLQTVSWLSDLVASDCGSEFYFCIWSGHCPFVYLVSQRSSWPCTQTATSAVA